MCLDLARLAHPIARTEIIATATTQEEEPPEQSEQSEKPAATPRAATLPTLRAPSIKRMAIGPFFLALTNTIRACIDLGTQLDAPTTSAQQSREQTALALRADPRRHATRDAFTWILANNPDRRELLRETTKAIDEALAADPDQTKVTANLITDICHALNIIIDPADLPDPLLHLLGEYCEPNGKSRGDITCIKPVDPDGYHPPPGTGPPW